MKLYVYSSYIPLWHGCVEIYHVYLWHGCVEIYHVYCINNVVIMEQSMDVKFCTKLERTGAETYEMVKTTF
jgi:hypothetical protein